MIKHYKIEIKRWDKDGINEINTILKFLTNLDSFLISFILKRWHESSKRQSVRVRIFMNDSTYGLPQSKAVTLELAFEESRATSGQTESRLPSCTKYDRNLSSVHSPSMSLTPQALLLLPHCPSFISIYILFSFSVSQSTMEWIGNG